MKKLILVSLIIAAAVVAQSNYEVLLSRPDITGLTGGTATDLDGIPTVGLAVGTMVAVFDGTETRIYRLTAGTDAESSPGVIRPDDFADPGNAKVWIAKLSSDPEETGYTPSGDDGDWADSTTFLKVVGNKGIFGYSSVGYGDYDSTHVNLGVNSQTGWSGLDYKYATISGGHNNLADNELTTIGGGGNNSARNFYATVSGGYNNCVFMWGSTISGGKSNYIDGDYSYIGGGEQNQISGSHSAIPGGELNIVTGNNSFAFGYNVIVPTHNTAQFFSSTVPGSLLVVGDIHPSGLLIADTISSPLDTLYLPDKVWVEELVTDTIESRGDIVFINDALGVQDSFYFDGEWRTSWPSGGDGYLSGEAAGGDLSGAYPNPQVVNDSHTHDARYFTEGESDGRFINNGEAASGDLSGTYPNPQVVNDSHTHDARYFTEGESDARFINNGETAGGDLTGSYPNPTLGTGVVGDNEIDYTSVTLNDFTNDAGFITDAADGDWTISGSDMYSAISGSVGIGTDMPTEKLDVDGNVKTSGYITVDTISSPLDTLYINEKVWVEELVTDTIESRGEFVFIKDAFGVQDSFYFDGAWRTSWPAGGGDDGDWADSTTFLMVNGQKGIFGYGNVGYGVHDSTHVNLGVACTTGASGSDYKYCTVGGGLENTASALSSTVSGGESNTASGMWATVGGGWFNTASGRYATVGGGVGNTASIERATVGGGLENTASALSSTVSGGESNTASGWYSAIPGGRADTVSGDYSFAFGKNVLVSSDYTAQFFSSVYPGKLIVMDTVGIGTTTPARTLHVNDAMRLEPRATAPSSPSEGDMYMDSGTHKLMVYDGTVWQACW